MSNPRRSLCTLLIVLSAFTTALPAAAAVVTLTSPITDPVSGLRYQLLSNGNWTDSEAAAEALGGHLATIANAEQQNFVASTFGSFSGIQRILWIGLNDPTQDATGTHVNNFVWADGKPIAYTNWDTGEPNAVSNVEFYVAMYYPNYHNPGSWNDWSNRTTDRAALGFMGLRNCPSRLFSLRYVCCLRLMVGVETERCPVDIHSKVECPFFFIRFP
jgi:hypothetical protein